VKYKGDPLRPWEVPAVDSEESFINSLRPTTGTGNRLGLEPRGAPTASDNPGCDKTAHLRILDALPLPWEVPASEGRE
jgi:hypothetical protein